MCGANIENGYVVDGNQGLPRTVTNSTISIGANREKLPSPDMGDMRRIRCSPIRSVTLEGRTQVHQ